MQNSVSPNNNVLVIDDDVVMRELLALLLDAEGRTVLTAESGDAALALLTSLPPKKLPAIILTDLKMSGLTGEALAKKLRSACPPPSLLIAMSGSKPADEQIKSFDAFLQKPFTIADLDTTLASARTIASRKRKPTPGRTIDIQAHAETQSVPALDETIYAKLLTVMGETQLPQLYTLFMNDVPERTARMQAAITVNDAATFTREAHAIKGSCGMLGATEIHALAGQMEAGGLACSPLLVDFRAAFERLRRILEERNMVV